MGTFDQARTARMTSTPSTFGMPRSSRITSGGFGHHVGQSIALGYVPAAIATPDGPGSDGFEIEIIGRRRPARLQPEPLFDPTGGRMRA